MWIHGAAQLATLPGGPHAVALGGGGLGRGIAHLFIWRLVWRAALAIWRIPILGPAIDIVLGLVVVAVIVLRSRLGPGWWQRLRRPSGGATGPRSRDGASPRDW
jgi:hypothetical protein